MNDLANLLTERLVGGLRRTTITKPSVWAESYRFMGSPYPGRWSFKHHPWLRGMHDSDADFNVGQKAAQMGFTETVLNIVFYYMDVQAIDCLYILPNKTPDASDFSAARFDPAIELSEHLQKIFSDVKNVGHKRAGQTNLYVRGSKSRSGLKSVPVGIIIFDEKDEMVQENIPLARERQSGNLVSKTWEISTPTIDDFGINATYKRSTQESFFFPCPSCSRHIRLAWPENFEVFGEYEDDPEVANSYLKCNECQARLPHETKHEYLAAGYWVKENEKSTYRGFHVNQLYSSTIRPHEIAESYLRGSINPSDEQEFYNSKLGLPHIVDGARINDADLKSCTSNYASFGSYEDGGYVTMGIDVGNWLHYVITLWHFNKDGSETGQVLKAHKCRDFSELNQLMNDFRVQSVVIDMQPERRKSFEFAQHFYGSARMCYYARGIQGKSLHLSSEEELQVMVDRTSWLDLTLSRFRVNKIRLPLDISHEFKVHLKSLVRIYQKDSSGNPIGKYVEAGSDGDHFAHACNYSEIARAIGMGSGEGENIDAPI